MKRLIFFASLLFSINLIVGCKKKYPENPFYILGFKKKFNEPVFGSRDGLNLNIKKIEIGGIDSTDFEVPGLSTYNFKLTFRNCELGACTFDYGEIFKRLGVDSISFCFFERNTWFTNEIETTLQFGISKYKINCLKNKIPNQNFRILSILNSSIFLIIRKTRNDLWLKGVYKGNDVLLKIKIEN